MTREELLKVAKPMMVNSEVAKTMDRKCQTRRIIKSVLNGGIIHSNSFARGDFDDYVVEMTQFDKKEIYPKWQVGDILWIREPAKVVKSECKFNKYFATFEYLSDKKQVYLEIPIEHLHKRWMSDNRGIPNGCIKEIARDFRIVTNVRVERLRDISDNDLVDEGLDMEMRTHNDFNAMRSTHWESCPAFKWFITLWNSTAPKNYKWEDNPYVFVYEFERVEATE